MTTMGKARAAVVAAVAGALLYAGCTSRAVATGDDGVPTVTGGADASAVETGTSDGASSATGSASDAGADGGPMPLGIPVGAPCLSDQEEDPSYAGANADEVGVIPNAPACNGGVCVIDHFQGRTSCPYGQSADGAVPEGAAACSIPGSDAAIRAAVLPWCSSRPPSDVVTCSCRCADLAGGTDDSGTFCSCPAGFTCTQLLSSLGAGLDTSLTGAYCLKAGTAFTPDGSALVCSACNPTTNPCE
jgi:hypothetical protein